MKMVQKLDEVHKDFLEEMASIGAGNASTLLSTLIDKEVSVTVSTFDMVSPKNISKLVTISKELIVVQYAPLGGELVGNILLVFPRKSALSLIDLLKKRKPGTTDWLSQNEQDLLKKTSGSLVKCYLDAIKNFLGIVIAPSELRIFSVFGDTINDLIDLTLKKTKKQVFYLNTKLRIKPSVEGEISFIFEETLGSFLIEKSKEMLAK
jgi:chemotaxis protein CheY-P-specific phosphatase CheC